LSCNHFLKFCYSPFQLLMLSLCFYFHVLHYLNFLFQLLVFGLGFELHLFHLLNYVLYLFRFIFFAVFRLCNQSDARCFLSTDSDFKLYDSVRLELNNLKTFSYLVINFLRLFEDISELLIALYDVFSQLEIILNFSGRIRKNDLESFCGLGVD
jgi:hypothetical protein